LITSVHNSIANSADDDTGDSEASKQQEDTEGNNLYSNILIF
jgi:hypothetical protein